MSEDAAQERRRTERLAQLGSLLAGLAHEIRNPLSTIGLNLQLVKEEFEGAETVRDKRTHKRISVVQEEVKRLQAILEEFLRFVRSPEVRAQPGDLNQLLQSLVDFMAPEMAGRGIALRYFPEHAAVVAPIDRDQLRAALLNLLRNAQDACREGDQVLVSVRLEEREVAVRVTDTGPGMSPEVRQRAFQPYFSTKQSGSGLGLPTARRIVEEHGGRIELTSEVGKGTQFTIHLPLGAAAATPRVAEA